MVANERIFLFFSPSAAQGQFLWYFNDAPSCRSWNPTNRQQLSEHWTTRSHPTKWAYLFLLGFSWRDRWSEGGRSWGGRESCKRGTFNNSMKLQLILCIKEERCADTLSSAWSVFVWNRNISNSTDRAEESYGQYFIPSEQHVNITG